MTSSLNAIITTPLIGKIYTLDDYLDKVSILPTKRILRIIIEPMLHQVNILHLQAMRELRGLDYYKRMKDTLFEILAAAFRVYHKKGWTLRVASIIDGMCDDIAEELYKRNFSASAKSTKFTDESSSANL